MDQGIALLGELDRLAGAAVRDDISPTERMARLAVLRDAHADAAALVATDPYTDGRHSRLLDTLLAAAAKRRRDTSDASGAAARLAQHQQAVALQAAVLNNITTDVPGLLTTRPLGLIVGQPPTADGILALATPATFTGSTIDLPYWDVLPPAVIDPVEKTELTTTRVHIPVSPATVHCAAFGLNVSMQTRDWADDGYLRIEQATAAIVNKGLASTLVADLATAAGAPLADIDTAAAAIASTGLVPDTLVVAPADVAKVRTYFAPAPSPYQMFIAPDLPTGTALVAARAGLWLLADQLAYLSAVEPSLLGVAVSAMRYGAAGVMVSGALAAATIA
jgi:hypothetical protein